MEIDLKILWFDKCQTIGIEGKLVGISKATLPTPNPNFPVVLAQLGGHQNSLFTAGETEFIWGWMWTNPLPFGHYIGSKRPGKGKSPWV